MPNILFLIDTSGSMNQRTFYGTTFLDIAKGAVENFIKVRQRSGAYITDRYMMITTQDFPKNVKVTWKDTSQSLLLELKKLAANGVTQLGQGLKTAFDLLNINRMISGIDNYGMGRNPRFLETTLIICLTDGHTFTSHKGPENELTLPLSNLPGFDLTAEPYRWDQRVFSLVLEIPGIFLDGSDNAVGGVPISGNTALNDLCEVTGGRSYKVTSIKTLNQCLESISQKAQNGVVLKFGSYSGPNHHIIGLKKLRSCKGTDGLSNGVSNGHDSDLLSFTQCQRMIYVRPPVDRSQPIGHWPIPEPYFPDRSSPTLPPRTAHPEITVFTKDFEPPNECEHVPSDVYELEGCPLTHMMLERKNNIAAWPVFVANSGRENNNDTNGKLGLPFGYLRTQEGRRVVMHVLPYNFPVLLPLLDELVARCGPVKGSKAPPAPPPPDWCKRFDSYVACMPLYYAPQLRQVLKKLSVGHLIPETMDYHLSHGIASHLKRLAHLSKIENDRISALVAQNDRLNESTGITVIPSSCSSFDVPDPATFQQLIRSLRGEPSTGHGTSCLPSQEFAGFSIPVSDPTNFKPNYFRNPFDISRDMLTSQVLKMKNNFYNLTFWGRSFHDMDNKDSMPIAMMGNYQKVVASRTPPLREIDPAPVRQHAFGNPYKLTDSNSTGKDKMLIDETEEFNESAALAKSFSPSPASPVPYQPRKRIRPPSQPPGKAATVSPLADTTNSIGANIEVNVNGKVRAKPPPSKLRKVVANQPVATVPVPSIKGQPPSSSVPAPTDPRLPGIAGSLPDAAWKQRTDKLVHAICRLIRLSDNKAFPPIEQLVSKLDGPLPHRTAVLKFLLNESQRFNRHDASKYLESKLQTEPDKRPVSVLDEKPPS